MHLHDFFAAASTVVSVIWCRNALSAEKLGLIGGVFIVILWLPANISFVQNNETVLEVETTCKPWTVFTPQSLSCCDQQLGHPFHNCRGLLAWLIKLIISRRHPTLHSDFYCCVLVWAHFESCHDLGLTGCSSGNFYSVLGAFTLQSWRSIHWGQGGQAASVESALIVRVNNVSSEIAQGLDVHKARCIYIAHSDGSHWWYCICSSLRLTLLQDNPKRYIYSATLL